MFRLRSKSTNSGKSISIYFCLIRNKHVLFIRMLRQFMNIVCICIILNVLPNVMRLIFAMIIAALQMHKQRRLLLRMY